MDPISAAVAMVQGVGYCATLVRNLIEVYQVLREGKEDLREHHSHIGDLLYVVTFIGAEWTERKTETPLGRVLAAVELTSGRLLKLLCYDTSRFKAAFFLLTRQDTIKKHLLRLEQQKSTLLIYLNLETSLAIAGMGKPTTKLRNMMKSHSISSKRSSATVGSSETAPTSFAATEMVDEYGQNPGSASSEKRSLPVHEASHLTVVRTGEDYNPPSPPPRSQASHNTFAPAASVAAASSTRNNNIGEYARMITPGSGPDHRPVVVDDNTLGKGSMVICGDAHAINAIYELKMRLAALQSKLRAQ